MKQLLRKKQISKYNVKNNNKKLLAEYYEKNCNGCLIVIDYYLYINFWLVFLLKIIRLQDHY